MPPKAPAQPNAPYGTQSTTAPPSQSTAAGPSNTSGHTLPPVFEIPAGFHVPDTFPPSNQ